MTKITTDFVGSETIAVTKQRLTDILAYWGASTAAYTTWGQARTALNALLTSTTAGTIGSTELAGSFLPKINFLNDPDDMIADALFGAGEQGVWLDPSDVANVAWRRNLLLWSQDLDVVASWPRAAVSITANSATAPDGTVTADKQVALATTAAHGVYQIIAGNAGSHTISGYAKAAEYSLLRVSEGGNGFFYGSFDLSAGTIVAGSFGGASYVSASITSVGSGWYRWSIVLSFGAASTIYPTLGGYPSGATLSPFGVSYTGDGTSGILLWGAQLELGSTATDYQRITDLNTEVIARFPDATMYQDAAGTTAVYAPGQPVGLRLDKSGRGNHATQSTAGSRLMYGIEPKTGTRNLLLATDTLATQSLTVTAAAHTLAFTGTGTVTLSGASTAGPLVGTGAGNRVSLTFTPTAASLTLTVSGSVTLAQLELGSTATNYQRVTTAFDVTEAGVNSCHYCQYDGSDDGMVTNSIDFTGTDKVSVFAGVRKLVEGLDRVFLELSATVNTTPGSFGLFAPSRLSGAYEGKYVGSLNGSAQSVTEMTGYAAPVSNVLSALYDISGATIAAESVYRINGATPTQTNNGTAAGTGNFGNYPLYLGRRGGTTLPFFGRDYGILVVGKAANATAIATTEMWLANKTSGVSL